jgi:hypothetical protein
MVGTADLILVVSVTLPFSRGTLKSTLMSTFFSLKLKSSMVLIIASNICYLLVLNIKFSG